MHVWVVLLVITFLVTVFQMFFIPESANFLVEQGSQDQYQEARDNLTFVAKTNGVENFKGQPYNQFRFVNERKKYLTNEQLSIDFKSISDQESSKLQGESGDMNVDDMDSIRSF